jgi:hypothetical protein
MSLKPYQLLKYNNNVLYTKDNKKSLSNPILNVAKFVMSSFRWTKHSLVTLLANHIIYYPSPINLTYAWSFGSAAGVCLVIQILSGIFLAMHYTPHIDLAFSSVERIMRDVNHGWFIRYVHANGASMFFVVVYCHICRGLYYGSYMAPRQLLWASGVAIFLLMMGTAFIGYVLPWGQMCENSCDNKIGKRCYSDIKPQEVNETSIHCSKHCVFYAPLELIRKNPTETSLPRRRESINNTLRFTDEVSNVSFGMNAHLYPKTAVFFEKVRDNLERLRFITQ